MRELVDWILNNKHWIFSGIGVLIISLIIGIIIKKNHTIIMKQKSGNNSINIQSSGNTIDKKK